MFNPFKKKDDLGSFKLDEESLPSVTEQNGGTPATPTSSGDDLGMPNFDNMKTEQSFGSSPIGTNPSSPGAPTNPFAAASSNPFASQSSVPLDNQVQQQNDDLHKDLTKAKLEMIESKVALLDSKVTNMDAKLDKIYQLILCEVSDETKARLNVGDALNSLKRR